MNKLVKTEPSLAKYEAMMYKSVRVDEFLEKRSPFKLWDIFFIIFTSSVFVLFLYFNSQSSVTSIIFSALLLSILGALTIIFTNKSRITLRKLTITNGIIALILFFLSFMAGVLHH